MSSRFALLALRQRSQGLKRWRIKPARFASPKYVSSSTKTCREGPGLKEFMSAGTPQAPGEEPLSTAPYLKPNELSGNGRKGMCPLTSEFHWFYAGACSLVIVACAYDFCHNQCTWRSMGAR
jgi:hypothetical protein